MEYTLLQIPVFWEESNNPEYIRVLNDYLFVTQKYQTGSREFIGGMPVTLENDCFKQLLRVDSNNTFVYNMTLKVDGERYLLFLSTYGSLYLIDRRLNFYIFIRPDGSRLPNILIKPFLFDGELVQFKGSKKYEFLLFDVLMYQGESFIEQNYHVRLDVISQAFLNVLFGYFEPSGIHISVKSWFPITDINKGNGDIYKYIETQTNKSRKDKLLADGLILQPFDTPYVISGPWNKFNNVVFKWKPAEDQTMDFKIKIEAPNKWVLLTRSGYPFTMPVTGVPAICKPTEANKRDFSDGDVAEFLFNHKTGLFKIVRARPNKEANSKDSILSIFNFINNPFTLDQISLSLESMVTGKNLKQALLGLSKSNLILSIFSKHCFFTKYEVKNIRSFYEKYIPGSHELEVRLVKKGKKDSSVDKSIFNYLMEYLHINFTPVKTFTIDVSMRGDNFISYRSSYTSFEDIQSGKSIINESKSSILRPYLSQENKGNLYNNILFKLALSEEVKTNKIIPLVSMVDGKRVYNSVRIKDRHSFELGSWRIDLTTVKSGFSMDEAKSKPDVYEIECEYIGSKVPFEQFLASFNITYVLLLQNAGYC